MLQHLRFLPEARVRHGMCLSVPRTMSRHPINRLPSALLYLLTGSVQFRNRFDCYPSHRCGLELRNTRTAITLQGLANRECFVRGLRAGRSNVNPPNPAAQRLARRLGSESFRAFVVSTCGQRLGASVAFGAALSVCGRFGRTRVGGGRGGAQSVQNSLALALNGHSG